MDPAGARPRPQLAPAAAADERRDEDEHEVELLLGAAPRIWRSTQNVLRDVGLDHWTRQPPPPLLEHRHDDGIDNLPGDGNGAGRASRAMATAAAAEAEVAAQIEERRRQRSPTPTLAKDDEGNDRICRLCFAEEHELNDDGTTMGRLISPCRCRGSMKYVHSGCLSLWRHKSRSSDASRLCGQCSSRYLFATSRWTPVTAFLRASQPLKLLASFCAVSLLVVVTGLVGTASLRCLAALEGTSLDSVRGAALGLLRPPAPPYTISLSSEGADVYVNSTSVEALIFSGSDKELHVRSMLDIMAQIRREHGDAWDVYRRAKQDREAIRAGGAEAAAGSRFADEDLLGVHDAGRPSPPPSSATTASDPGRKAETITNAIKEWFSGPADGAEAHDSASDGPAGTSPEVQGYVQLLELTDSFLRSYAEGNVRTSRVKATESEKGDGEEKEKQGSVAEEADDVPTVWLRFNYVGHQGWITSFTEPVLERMFPRWLGPLRFLPDAAYLTVVERLRGFTRIPFHLWNAVTKSAVLLSILVCESRREILWTMAKVVVAATIAFLDEHYQAAPPLPPNAALLGPPRSRSRLVAYRIREALSSASSTVFGCHWANWWGGLPLSTYLGPRSFSTPERVEFSQLAPIFGPVLTNLVYYACLLLTPFSERADRFRQSHARWWKRADWLENNRSAAEGYRRMLSVMLGDRDQADKTSYDLFLDEEDARLLPGRVRPFRMANLPYESLWQTVIAVGCLVTVTIAFAVALQFAWESLLAQMYHQAARSALELVQLVGECGRRLGTLPRQLESAARRRIEAAISYLSASFPFLSASSTRVRAQRESEGEGDADDAGPPVDPFFEAAGAAPAGAEQGGGGAAGAAMDEVGMVLNAMLGCFTVIYGSFHASTWVLTLMLTYLPFIPFALGYVLLEEWIRFDVAQQEVLDRYDPPLPRERAC
ncbi:hypothetical protein ACQY0O_007542 [Thecaphora frezii]